MNNENFVFMSYDGDNAGRLVGQSVIADDVQGLHDVSARIVHGHTVVVKWVEDHGGQIVSQGGDEGTFMVPAEAVEDIEQLRKDYQFTTQLTMTVGVGSSLSEAGKCLLVGKFRGKDQVVQYEPSIEQEIEAAKQRVAEGTASEEERKLGEAYLKPKEEGTTPMAQSEHEDDCQYCNEVEGNEDLQHCQYCHDAEAAEGEDDCQYCQEADAEEGAADHEHTGDDCQYCQEAEADAQESHTHEDGSEADCQYCQEAAPESGDPASEAGAIADENDATADDSEDYAGADLNDPAIPKPDGSEAAPGLAPQESDVASPSNAVLDQAPGEEAPPVEEESIYDADEHSAPAMSAIVAQLDENNPSEANDGSMNQIGEDEMPINEEMEDGTSRPDGYDSNNPSDMGLSEDEVPQEDPDLSDVLQQGLDSHADNIQREKVVQMVGEALEGFKASKQVLERAKEQAPQLYQSSLSMLKAMIEMARMLGLGEDVEQEAPGAQEEIESAPSEEARPEEREPAHFGQPGEEAPEKGAARPESREPAHFAKPASKEDAPGKKPVGQSASQ